MVFLKYSMEAGRFLCYLPSVPSEKETYDFFYPRVVKFYLKNITAVESSIGFEQVI